MAEVKQSDQLAISRRHFGRKMAYVPPAVLAVAVAQRPAIAASGPVRRPVPPKPPPVVPPKLPRPGDIVKDILDTIKDLFR